MKTKFHVAITKLFYITLFCLIQSSTWAQIGAIKGDTEVCLNSSATCTTDFTQIPEGERKFYYKWKV